MEKNICGAKEPNQAVKTPKRNVLAQLPGFKGSGKAKPKAEPQEA